MKHCIFKFGLVVAICLLLNNLYSQELVVQGLVSHLNKPLSGVKVLQKNTSNGVYTDSEGGFRLLVKKDEGELVLLFSISGFRSKELFLDGLNLSIPLKVELEEDLLSLDMVVVSGTRSEVPKYETAVLLRTLGKRSFEATQSLTLAEGLSFSPGLRMENNCQNCGFTQLRMNGLEGPYSQILINSRPVFSALAGVYGLEMIPASMIERVEIVRGGGSVLFGGNAIAGTVNIITKEPVKNTFEVGWNEAFTDLKRPDRSLFFNGAVIAEDGKTGMNFYGYKRNRREWDANGDGFSEMTRLNNHSFGGDFFYKPTNRGKLKLNFNAIQEYRRGGDRFELPPHLATVAEELKHNILGGQVSWESYSENLKHKYAFYGAFQSVNRHSYYGAGSVTAQPGDTLSGSDFLALNAYGRSNDRSAAVGAQYTFEPNEKYLLIAGTEGQHNRVVDEMVGYKRSVNQVVNNLGVYSQLQLKPWKSSTFLLGGRMDFVGINGEYLLSDSLMATDLFQPVFVPRISWMQELNKGLKLRFSFAQGYRAPQAFNEDLHIETVGGAARFIQLSNDLKTERSNSFSGSLNFTKSMAKIQLNAVVEGFYTQLQNPFILSDAVELPNGVAVQTKRNGNGAYVAGSNLELNLSIAQKLVVQSGFTQQVAKYNEREVLWQGENLNGQEITVSTQHILRTPNQYGFLTFQWFIHPNWNLNLSSVYTGKMFISRTIDVNTEEIQISQTPHFFEQNVKISFTHNVGKNLKMNASTGIQNIFNSFQKDLDFGFQRDAAYIYGPNRPRTLFISLKFSVD
jgi:outer membrane receptor for ferrienterochelin and colicins